MEMIFDGALFKKNKLTSAPRWWWWWHRLVVVASGDGGGEW